MTDYLDAAFDTVRDGLARSLKDDDALKAIDTIREALQQAQADQIVRRSAAHSAAESRVKELEDALRTIATIPGATLSAAVARTVLKEAGG